MAKALIKERFTLTTIGSSGQACPADERRAIVRRMIVLFTDFGLSGPYTGQVEAVLQQSAAGIPVIRLFADAPASQPKPSAYLLAAYATWFPAGTVFLCVVDPGVGSERRAVIVEADRQLYIGPDNGLFELILRRARVRQVWEIDWRPPSISASFHGRDLFAPVAARLARGEPATAMAHAAAPIRCPDWPDDLAEIVYIDHYGNAMTGLRDEAVPEAARLRAGGRVLVTARTFSAVPTGEAFWYVNSNGLVEIAVNNGRADNALGLSIGCEIAVLT
jgi:S-adenosyl-L-methionine hydrolase (adenosine-forming)